MAVDMFIKIKDIDGESQDAKHKDEIDVLAWSWGLTNPGSPGAGAGRGKANFQDLTVTKFIDKATPDLILACASGKHIEEATLAVRRSGGEKQQLDYIVVKMTEVRVTSVQQLSAGGEAEPVEDVSFNFTKFTYTYTPQDPRGGPGESETIGWDIARNKKV